MKEEKAENYVKDLYGNHFSVQARNQSKTDFLKGWEACFNYLNSFEKGEMVEVTDPYNIKVNRWFTREYFQQDSDGKFACIQQDGSISRWDFIRKIIE